MKNVAADIGLLGYPEIIFKSDNEPSFVALKDAVKMERHERIVMENPPVKESKSIGAVENAVQQVQGQFRALKDTLESRIGIRISGESAVVPWLVMHSARTLDRFNIGLDGKAPYRRWKGKDFRREIAEFCEIVMYLKPGTRGQDTFNSRWERGVWLGVRDESGEIIIATPEGVVKARNFKRMASMEERWSASAIRNMRGLPWEPVPGKSDDSIPVRVRLPEEGRHIPTSPDNLGEPPRDIKRRARMTREDVIRIGFTIHCPGCRAISRKAPSQNHTEACRARIEQALLEEGGVTAKRVATGNDRFASHMAKSRQTADDTPDDDAPEGGRSESSQKRSLVDSAPPVTHTKLHKKNESVGKKSSRDGASSSDEPPAKMQ